MRMRRIMLPSVVCTYVRPDELAAYSTCGDVVETRRFGDWLCFGHQVEILWATVLGSLD